MIHSGIGLDARKSKIMSGNQIDLNLLDLSLLYVIVKYSQDELARVVALGLPPLANALGITDIIGDASNREAGIYNQFLKKYGIGDQIRSAEAVYRKLDNKLAPAKLVFPQGNTEARGNRFTPTLSGIKLVRLYLTNPDPRRWPTSVPVSNGFVNINQAQRPIEEFFKLPIS